MSKNKIGYAHMDFSRMDLLWWIIRGGLFVEIKINYDTQILEWKWKDRPAHFTKGRAGK